MLARWEPQCSEEFHATLEKIKRDIFAELGFTLQANGVLRKGTSGQLFYPYEEGEPEIEDDPDYDFLSETDGRA
jgi:hypothetical protein